MTVLVRRKLIDFIFDHNPYCSICQCDRMAQTGVVWFLVMSQPEPYDRDDFLELILGEE